MKLNKIFLPLIGAMVLGACAKDEGIKPQEPTTGQTASLELNMEGEFGAKRPAEDFRALSFDTSYETPPFIHEEGVTDWKTHCFLRKADGSAQAYALVDWTATQATDGSISLVMKGHTLTLQSSGSGPLVIPQPGEEWYIAGIAGDGRLNADRTKVDFRPDVAKDAALQPHQARTPLAFGWKKFKVAAASGERAPKIKVTFKPQGALLHLQVNNTTAVNDGTFAVVAPLTVKTNALTTDGAFDYSLGVPMLEGANPTFAFASTTATEEVLIREVSVAKGTSKSYVLWGYPRPASHLSSGSFRSETSIAPYRTYSSTAKTEAVVRTKAYYHAIAHATEVFVDRPRLPIEQMTEYNLAGGAGLTTVPSTSLGSFTAEGTQGVLRFANRNSSLAVASNPHANNLSGYYSWNRISTANLPGATLVDVNGASIILKNKYRLPDVDDHYAIAPTQDISYEAASEASHPEYGRLADGTRQTYRALYSAGYVNVPTTGDATVYAIRHLKPQASDAALTLLVFGELDRTYPKATDDVMACAYRYTRHGGMDLTNDNLTDHFTVEVVYLGPGTSETLTTLASKPESFWTAGIKRTIPAAGFVISNDLRYRGRGAAFYSATKNASDLVYGYHSYKLENVVHASGHSRHTGLALRLFTKE